MTNCPQELARTPGIGLQEARASRLPVAAILPTSQAGRLPKRQVREGSTAAKAPSFAIAEVPGISICEPQGKARGDAHRANRELECRVAPPRRLQGILWGGHFAPPPLQPLLSLQHFITVPVFRVIRRHGESWVHPPGHPETHGQGPQATWLSQPRPFPPRAPTESPGTAPNEGLKSRE